MWWDEANIRERLFRDCFSYDTFIKRTIYWIVYQHEQGRSFHPLYLWRSKARILIIVGEWDGAERIYRDIISLVEGNRDEREMAEAYGDLSQILYLRSSYHQAQELARRAYRLFKKQGLYQGQLRSLGLVANIYNGLGDYRKALRIYGGMEKMAVNSGFSEMAAECWRNMALCYFWLGDSDQALSLFEKSRAWAESSRHQVFLAGVIHAIGLTYRERREYDRARDYLQESLKLFNLIGDKRSIGMALGSLAGLCYYNGDYPGALELYQRQMNIATILNDRYFLACVYGDISMVYLEMGYLDKAGNMARRELEMAQQMGDKLAIGDSHFRLGLLYYYRNEIVEAEAHLRRALEFAREIKSRRFLPLYLMEFAWLQYRQNRLAEAKDLLKEMRQVMDETDENLSVQWQALDLLLSFPEADPKSENQALSWEGKISSPEKRAWFLYHLGLLTGKRDCHMRALEIFNDLYTEKGYPLYKNMVKKIQIEAAL